MQRSSSSPAADGDLAICTICGQQYAEPLACPPAACKVCEDDRQWTPGAGQRWTSLEEMKRDGYRNEIVELEPGVHSITTVPKFGIGQRCVLIQNNIYGNGGNVLWDCVSFIDAPTLEAVKALGGVDIIVVSHPHFLGSCLAWSNALAPTPLIYLHAADREWVTRPADTSSYRYAFWDGDDYCLTPGLRIVRLGGHFPGSSVLLLEEAWRDGEAVAFTSDTILPVPHRNWVSFMFSFPNMLPLPAFEVERIQAAVREMPEDFERLYGPFATSVIEAGAKDAVLDSAQRYLDALAGRYHGRV